MTFPTTLRLAAIALVLALLAPTMSMAQDDPIATSQFYRVHYLRPGMVEILAKQACGGRIEPPCPASGKRRSGGSSACAIC